MIIFSSNGDSNQLKNEELRQTLDKAYDLGNRLANKGRELSSVGQYITDWVEITREALPLISSTKELNAVKKSWVSTTVFVGQTLDRLNEIDIGAISSTSAASALTSVISLPSLSTPSKTAEVQSVAKRIEELTNRSHEKQSVVSLMKSLDLDTSLASKRSPLEQLETSYKAFEATVDSGTPALTSLIPMRECILETIAILLTKRKHQEKARNTKDKVRSILNQLKRDSICIDLINDLSIQCGDILHKDLSSSKQLKILRSEWQHALTLATLWLKSFLSALDPVKVRRRST